MADHNDNSLNGPALSANGPDTAQDIPAVQGDAAPRDMRPEEHAAETFADILPVLPVRDVVIFNYMILPLFIGREKSVRAVEAALKRGRHLLVCAQREEHVDEPGPADLYEVGTVVQVMRMLKMPDSRVKVLVQGVSRARVSAWSRLEPFMEAHVEAMHEVSPEPEAPAAEIPKEQKQPQKGKEEKKPEAQPKSSAIDRLSSLASKKNNLMNSINKLNSIKKK